MTDQVKALDCLRGVHTPPLWGETKGMYPETNTLPKQPYPVRSAAGLVDLTVRDAKFIEKIPNDILSEVCDIISGFTEIEETEI